jgi:hypothetical protein
MKTFKITAMMVLLGALTLGVADEVIDAQISEINAASTEEKVQLMNQFKLKLSTLTEEERAEAISKLQVQTHTQTRERNRVNQTEQTENMKRSEQMQQHQMMNQTMQQNIGAASGGSANTSTMPMGKH